jgi:hypothetical protein
MPKKSMLLVQSQLLNFVSLIVVMIFLWAVAGVILFGDQSEYFNQLVSRRSCRYGLTRDISMAVCLHWVV